MPRARDRAEKRPFKATITTFSSECSISKSKVRFFELKTL